jgi:hypothetical protein
MNFPSVAEPGTGEDERYPGPAHAEQDFETMDQIWLGSGMSGRCVVQSDISEKGGGWIRRYSGGRRSRVIDEVDTTGIRSRGGRINQQDK